MSNWLEKRMREKDEWRFATMEYGGQCVQTIPTILEWECIANKKLPTSETHNSNQSLNVLLYMKSFKTMY